MRVATFNARHGAGRLGITFHRRLVETCRALDADVLALQEVDRCVMRSWFRDQPALVASRLGLEHATAPAKRTPVGGRQCNALCARGVVGDVDVVELPGHSGAERRVALLATVFLPGVELSVACTHLQHGPPAGAQLDAVVDALSRRPRPRLLLGDLNLGPAQVEPRLARAGLHAVDSGPTFPAPEPRRRIDWIARSDDVGVVHAAVVRPLVSDHRAVVADLSWRGGA